MPLMPRLLTEFTGSFLFMAVIALAGEAGALAPLAIGAGLMAAVYLGGHVSGAHYNPAVTLAMLLRGRIGLTDSILYVVVQLVAAALAFSAGYLVSGSAGGIQPGPHAALASAVAVEVIFTTMLALTVLNVAATRATAGNSFYGLAIGIVIVAAAFVGGPISGGAFNPAVGFGATIAAAVFKAGSLGSLWIYLVGPLAGGAIAAAIHRLQVGVETVPGSLAAETEA